MRCFLRWEKLNDRDTICLCWADKFVRYFFVYAHLLETKKIKPHIPPRYTNRVKTQRGNFWDAETQMFYKWHQIEELKKIRGVKNDRA